MTKVARRASAAWRWACGLALALGCGGGADRPPVAADPGRAGVSDHHARRIDGPTGLPIAATGLFGLFTVAARVDGVAGPPFLVDTGAPVTFIDATSYGGRGVEGRSGVATLELGALSLVGVPVVWGNPFGLAPLVGGVLGVNLICQLPSTWDWQRSRFYLGAPPTDVEVTGEVIRRPFRLVGGGSLALGGGEFMAVPATRLVVEVEVESRRLRMLVDTGASSSALRDDLVAAFTGDGRGTIALDVSAQGGAMRQSLFRVRRIAALGVAREGALVVGYGAAQLAVIAAEVGGEVDGLLGADFFLPWLTTIDYPRNELRLQRYRDGAHVRDAMTRVGLLLGVNRDGSAAITTVAVGSDAAAQGYGAGERLVSIDGVAVEGMSRDAVDWRLRGAVGETRRVRTDAHDAALRVEDMLPLR